MSDQRPHLRLRLPIAVVCLACCAGVAACGEKAVTHTPEWCVTGAVQTAAIGETLNLKSLPEGCVMQVTPLKVIDPAPKDSPWYAHFGKHVDRVTEIRLRIRNVGTRTYDSERVPYLTWLSLAYGFHRLDALPATVVYGTRFEGLDTSIVSGEPFKLEPGDTVTGTVGIPVAKDEAFEYFEMTFLVDIDSTSTGRWLMWML